MFSKFDRMHAKLWLVSDHRDHFFFFEMSRDYFLGHSYHWDGNNDFPLISKQLRFEQRHMFLKMAMAVTIYYNHLRK
jgi:hypothetical protein